MVERQEPTVRPAADEAVEAAALADQKVTDAARKARGDRSVLRKRRR